MHPRDRVRPGPLEVWARSSRAVSSGWGAGAAPRASAAPRRAVHPATCTTSLAPAYDVTRSDPSASAGSNCSSRTCPRRCARGWPGWRSRQHRSLIPPPPGRPPAQAVGTGRSGGCDALGERVAEGDVPGDSHAQAFGPGHSPRMPGVHRVGCSACCSPTSTTSPRSSRSGSFANHDPATIQPSSIDFRLDRYFRVFENHLILHIDPAADLVRPGPARSSRNGNYRSSCTR